MSDDNAKRDDDAPLIRVMALHALAYCERLYYLEEVEEIRVADDRVFAGRTLHESKVDRDEEWSTITLESEKLGLRGKVDYARHRDGRFVAYEHKRGRSKGEEAWASDRLQVIAYAALLSEHIGKPVTEGRIRYHANNKTVIVPVDAPAHDELLDAVSRARTLSAAIDRPPVAENENLCARCSLSPVCLPEEERLLHSQEQDGSHFKPERLFPANDERRIVHVTEAGTRLGKSGEQVVVTPREGELTRLPGRDICALVLHGAVQLSAQLLQFCVARDIAVHWLSAGGRYLGALAPAPGVQRRLRQYRGLEDPELRLELTRRLAAAKIENQLRFLIRSSRKREVTEPLEKALRGLRAELRSLSRADNADSIRGHEGAAGRLYFGALPDLIGEDLAAMHPAGRSRRPPKDRFNAALSFLYSLLYRDVTNALLIVGLDPSLGFFHQPRSAAYPLALDLMELFRVTLGDMPLLAAVNRRQWQDEHFEHSRQKVWLSSTGRKLAIGIYESRKQEQWRHPVLEYSLSYARAMELEARLLEKEWSGNPGLFANLRLR